MFFSYQIWSLALGLHWPFAEPATDCHTVSWLCNLHELSDEKQRQNAEQNPVTFQQARLPCLQ
jgi:hypothetical protein